LLLIGSKPSNEADSMKLMIPGGSGQVGTILARDFHAQGHEIVVLSRLPARAPWRVVAWDARTLGDWTAELERADAVVNLAGRSVNCRYHARHPRVDALLALRIDRDVRESLAVPRSDLECGHVEGPRVSVFLERVGTARPLPHRVRDAAANNIVQA